MSWQLKVQEPSGETRTVALKGAVTLGRSEPSELILRDPTIPQEAALLWPKESTLTTTSPFWLRVSESSPGGRLGDFTIREAQVPAGIPFQLGETKLVIEQSTPSLLLPPYPTGVRPWLTRSEAGRKILWTAKKTAPTPLSIYLAGETGTGKEVLAHLIHAWSDRKSGPFIPLNCAALALSLVESELFGHVKGAFTGAHQQRTGALMQAHNGTLFLDEIGDLPLDIQVKLLRFLENGEIRPIGSDHSSKASVRLICATHLPLRQLVREGRFRQDLYYRLASVTLEIPTLRSRPEDIEFLANKFATEAGKILSPRALLRLKAHHWPGNVRELSHAIDRASSLAESFQPVLNEDGFEFLMAPDHIREAPELELGSSVLTLKEMEKLMLMKALKLSQGNRTQAAEILGVARSTLFEMLKRHKIQGPRKMLK